MINITAIKQFRGGGVGLFIDYLARQPGNKNMRIDGPLKFKEVELFAEDCSGPDILLEGNAPQKLMDDLYNAGIRPTEGAGSAGSFAAQAAHLKDMRRLVFEEDFNV